MGGPLHVWLCALVATASTCARSGSFDLLRGEEGLGHQLYPEVAREWDKKNGKPASKV